MGILDGVQFSAVPAPTAPDELPFVTHKGEMTVAGHRLRCYRISDGRTIIDADDFKVFLRVLGLDSLNG